MFNRKDSADEKMAKLALGAAALFLLVVWVAFLRDEAPEPPSTVSWSVAPEQVHAAGPDQHGTYTVCTNNWAFYFSIVEITLPNDPEGHKATINPRVGDCISTDGPAVLPLNGMLPVDILLKDGRTIHREVEVVKADTQLTLRLYINKRLRMRVTPTKAPAASQFKDDTVFVPCGLGKKHRCRLSLAAPAASPPSMVYSGRRFLILTEPRIPCIDSVGTSQQRSMS